MTNQKAAVVEITVMWILDADKKKKLGSKCNELRISDRITPSVKDGKR